jgi:hypothetical protein
VELSDQHLLFELLRTYLSKALRAASDTGTQDRIAYAVQQLLQQYKKCHNISLTDSRALLVTDLDLSRLHADSSSISAAAEVAAVIADSDDGVQGTSISYTADGAAAATVAMPKDFYGILRTDSNAIDRGREARDTGAPQPCINIDVDDGMSNTNEFDSVHLLMEMLAPYWSSALSINRATNAAPSNGPYIPFYFASLQASSGSMTSSADRAVAAAAPSSRSNHFEHWITTWARHLIDQLRVSSVARHEFWEACRTAVSTDTSTALFLLPYIVRDVLMHGERTVSDQVIAEVRAVLSPPSHVAASSSDLDQALGVTSTDAVHAGTLDENEAASSSSFRHRTMQAMFSLLDTMRRWHSGGQFLAKDAQSTKPFANSCRGDAAIERLLMAVSHADCEFVILLPGYVNFSIFDALIFY